MPTALTTTSASTTSPESSPKRPAGALLVPAGAAHPGMPKRQWGSNSVLLGAVVEVGADLGLGRVGPRPVALDLERERVEVRGDVAGAARIAVVVPGAADAAPLLEQDEVLEAGLLQPDGHAQPAGSGSDDRDAQSTWGSRGIAHLGRHASPSGLGESSGADADTSDACSGRVETSTADDRRRPTGERSTRSGAGLRDRSAYFQVTAIAKKWSKISRFGWLASFFSGLRM